MKVKFAVTVPAAVLGLAFHISSAMGQGATAFTYQGRLVDGGTNVTDTNGMIFSLYSAVAGGSPVSTPITNTVAVSNGLFSVNLDFGAGAFNGGARWLDIAVSNGAAIQELSPRTQVLPTPYALYASVANTASNFSGATFVGNGGGLTNVAASPRMEVFLNSGTFYAPSNVTRIIVEAWGGGGMGASGSSYYDIGGGGGGAGGYAKVFFNVTPNGTYSIVVGAGGTAAAPTGGSTGMGGIALATGGLPGSSPTSTSRAAGGPGGGGPALSSTVSVTQGGTGRYGTTSGGGDGGDAGCGGPGGLGNIGGSTTGEAGHFPGGGGGGGNFSGTTTGGNGANGEVIVYY